MDQLSCKTPKPYRCLCQGVLPAVLPAASSLLSRVWSLGWCCLTCLQSCLTYLQAKQKNIVSMQNWLDNPFKGATVCGSLSKRGETQRGTQGWCPALPGIICHSTREYRLQLQIWQIQVFGREDQNLKFLKREKKRHCFDNLEKWCNKTQ